MWEKAIPVQAIEQGCYIGGNGSVTIGFDLALPGIYTLSPQDAENIHRGFVNLLKILPVGTTMQKLDFFYWAEHRCGEPEGNRVHRENMKKFEGRPVLRHYSKLLLTFPNGTRKKETDRDTPYLKLPDYIFKKPFRDFAKAYRRHQPDFATAENMLNSFIKARRMDDEQLGRLLHEYLSLSFGHGAQGTFRDETLQPLSFSEGGFMIGGDHVKVVTMQNEGAEVNHHQKGKPVKLGGGEEGLPDLGLECSLVMPLGLGFPVRHILSTVITVTDNDRTVRKLKSESTMLNIQSSIGYMPAKMKQQEIKDYIETVTRHQYQSAEVSVTVVIPAESEEKAKGLARMAESAFSTANGTRAWTENEEAANVFMSNCPGGAELSSRRFISVADLAACYLHKESQYGSDINGLVFADRSGAPVVVDLWDTKNTGGISNRNELIIGGSGSGKSYTLNTMVNQYLGQGAHVVIADIGNSSKRSTFINRGRHFDSGDPENLRFNIFLCEKDKAGKWSPWTAKGKKDGRHIEFVITVISAIWKGGGAPNQEEKAVLRDMAESYYGHINSTGEFPGMENFCAYLGTVYRNAPEKQAELGYLDINSLLMLLKPYATGNKKELMNAKESIDITGDRLVVFDFKSAQKSGDDFSIITIMMINLVLQKMEQLPLSTKKIFYIDEMLDFISDPKMGGFIASMFRTIRKEGGKIGLSGQNLKFIDGAPAEIRDSIETNCDIKLLLNSSEEPIPRGDLTGFLKMTEFEMELLDTSKPKREFYLKTGNRGRVFWNEVSPFADAIFTTEPSESEEVDRLLEKTGDLCAAVNQYIENRTIQKKKEQ